MWSLPDPRAPGRGSRVALSRRLAAWRAAGADIATRLFLPVALAASAYLLWVGLATLRGAGSGSVPGPTTPYAARGDSLPLGVAGITCIDDAGLPLDAGYGQIQVTYTAGVHSARAPGEMIIAFRYDRDGRLAGCVLNPAGRRVP